MISSSRKSCSSLELWNIDRTTKNELRKISLASRRFLPPCDISQIKYAFNIELKLSSSQEKLVVAIGHLLGRPTGS